MSGFKRAAKKDIPIIPGTKIIPQRNCRYVSSGLSAIDSILGGGIPVGSMLLIDEDTTGFYAEALAKHYLSEGILSDQDLVIGSGELNINNDYLCHLPGENKTLDESLNENATTDQEMTIAWRYQNLKVVDSAIQSDQTSIGHVLDLNTTIDPSLIKKVNVSIWPDKDCDQRNLVEFIKTIIAKGECRKEKKITRIALLKFGSPLWDALGLAKTLFIIKSIIRNSHSVCLITLPGRCLPEKGILEKCINICDYCVRLEDFSGLIREKNPVLKDFHGIFNVIKLAPINAIVSQLPIADLAFKLRRRKFIIETLHLPPELEGSTEREQDELVSCFSIPGSNKSLDF